ncbi:hypothetical protein [Pseudomarimonas salicorniae]|uniref:YXWGXW repeat-containing protein n=1 Tax=Pseudomarimonas salicorniae TaxID=2933270 RepID=A0ABT0GD46_9GAMM|nr:hypothetical protein [Lysobacter sp. CAU 1642]MCK7592464.1 hypothetical protein [Lysobacter sp. CAU 1642]
MLRILPLAALALLLAGCASSPSYRYYGERTYSDGYGGQVVAEPVRSYQGGYVSPVWYDYPAYYSLFWSINRSYVDPYWNPGFYYGVTWFPRNYYSVLYRSWHGPGYYSGWYGRHWNFHLAYSPYRHAWVDHYYDWYPWYVTYPHVHRYYPARYGNPRNEAERLTRYSNAYRGDGLPAGQGISGFGRAARSQALVDARREGWRGADYGSPGGRGRADPDVSGFRQPATGRLPTGRAGEPSARQDPQVSGFRGPEYGDAPRQLPPRSAPRENRAWRDEGVAYPYDGSNAPVRGRPIERREASVGTRSSSISLPEARSRGNVAGGPPRVGGTYGSNPVERAEPRSAPIQRAPIRGGGDDYAAPPRREIPRYQAAPQPRYQAPAREAPRYEAPARAEPRYEAPARQPRYEAPARVEPRYEAPRPEPRYEAPRAEPRSYSAPAPRERAEPMMRGEPRVERPSRDEE